MTPQKAKVRSLKSKGGSPPTPSSKPRPLEPPANGKGVTIRMYRQGLGDAFLLAFGTPRSPRYLLIDCGVHKSQTGGGKKMQRIAADVAAATHNRLHVVVATHEHTDHLSGFLQGYKSFQNVQIDQLWLGWTESREDKVANRLREKRGHAQKLIEEAVKKLEDARKLGLADAEPVRRVAGLKEFLEVDLPARAVGALAEAAGVPAAKSVNPTGNEVALALLGKWAKGNVECMRPGKCVPITPKARAYVLGPPTNEGLLRRSDPASGSASEVYLGASGLNLAGTFLVGGLLRPAATNDPVSRMLDLTMPFEACFRLSEQQARSYSLTDARNRRQAAFFCDQYGFDPGLPDALKWRQLGSAWLGAIEELALNLDSDTNNTSLALAIELGEQPGSGPVLLFPGDAQVGSWLSWKDLEWSVGGKKVTMESLFARTRLYKVGHHASHNGTLKGEGLERMSDDLIALIPVDQKAAAKLRGWNMPYDPLYEALLKKTGGRVLRSDEEPELLANKAARPGGLSADQWELFRGTYSDPNGDYFELTVPG
jgi:hypothetical protein